MKHWIKYIVFACLIGLYACQQANTAYTHNSSLPIETKSNITDLKEDYAKRLHQQYEWSDALTSSFQISVRSSENRIRIRRTYTSPNLGSRIYSKYSHQYAILFRKEEQTAHQLNLITTLINWVKVGLSKEDISYPFHSFW
jgi:hypothetical protein